jgi:SAM-dependent methyltransferase
MGDGARVQWDHYWGETGTVGRLYGWIASFYRKFVIAPELCRNLSKHLSDSGCVLHAGAGAGEIDLALPSEWGLVSIDFSCRAVRLNRLRGLSAARSSRVVQANIFALPFADGQFEVSFNLGVMEHFTDSQVIDALREMRRVTSAQGCLIIYWPPAWGPTVLVLHTVSRILRLVGCRLTQLHPPEINLFRSRSRCEAMLSEAGLRALKFRYGPQDLFTHVIITAQPL